MNLADYKWKKRVLLVFSPTAADPRFTRQLAIFAENKAGYDDRDLVEMHAIGNMEMRLRNMFRVSPPDFAVILVGKDGNEKHRWTDIAPMDQINHRIDRMPMRRQEMKEK